MHIKTTKCNHFCLVASVANQEVFNRPEAQVKDLVLARFFKKQNKKNIQNQFHILALSVHLTKPAVSCFTLIQVANSLCSMALEKH